jgi:hypothetical protein
VLLRNLEDHVAGEVIHQTASAGLQNSAAETRFINVVEGEK